MRQTDFYSESIALRAVTFLKYDLPFIQNSLSSLFRKIIFSSLEAAIKPWLHFDCPRFDINLLSESMLYCLGLSSFLIQRQYFF